MPEGVLQAAQGKTFTPMHLVLRRVGASLKEGKRCAAWRKGLRAIDFLNGGSDAIHHRIAGRVFVERFGILDDSGSSTRLEFATRPRTLILRVADSHSDVESQQLTNLLQMPAPPNSDLYGRPAVVLKRARR